jgi:multicomponent Na+:H+ antiporter subunit C
MERHEILDVIGELKLYGMCASFDEIPQAMVITGIVVAFSASAIAITLVLRLFQETGHVTLRPDALVKPPANGADNWYM